MTQPQPSPTGPPPARGNGLPWIRTILAGLLMLVVLAGAAGVWYVFFRDSGPPPVGTNAPAIPGASIPAATPSASTITSGASVVPAGSIDAGGTASGTSQLDGVWSIDPSIGAFDYGAGVFSGSWAGYRVQEELVGVGGATAVGRTPGITGTITIAGTQVTGADMTVDLTTLVSDQRMRDGQLARQGVQTATYPTAAFKLTQPIALGSVPVAGQEVSATAVGDLTIHGVTRSVQIPLSAKLTNDVIGVSGSLTFTWEDFGMQQPSSVRVLSLSDEVTMEFQAFFRKGG